MPKCAAVSTPANSRPDCATAEVLILAPYLGTFPTVGLYPTRAQQIGKTVNISQMDYNLTLLIGDMDELIRCDGGHGSPASICFDKSVRKINDPPKFVDDFV